jgi:hypothetical protein
MSTYDGSARNLKHNPTTTAMAAERTAWLLGKHGGWSSRPEPLLSPSEQEAGHKQKYRNGNEVVTCQDSLSLKPIGTCTRPTM